MLSPKKLDVNVDEVPRPCKIKKKKKPKNMVHELDAIPVLLIWDRCRCSKYKQAT